MSFGQPDRIPLWPGEPRESTLEAWHRQGLPEGADYYEYLMQKLGVQRRSRGRGNDLGSFFKMIPTFEEKVLEHRDGHYVVQDWMGAVVELSDEYDLTYLRYGKDFVTRKWHRFPVQSRQDWEERMKRRFDPHHPERFPVDFEARCREQQDPDRVLEITVNGPFWQLREWCGFENLCMLMVDQPDLVQDMIDFWAGFVLQTLQILLEQAELDLVWISEDMAYKMHSMISPAMARRFLLPTWKTWTESIHAWGCPVVAMDSDGHMADLLPLWIEAGFDACYPCEVAAGNDIVEYRRTYGRQMTFIGGVDKRALAVGGEALRGEVMRVVPPMLAEGGFIPGCDHGVPPDVSWPNFVEYTRLLAELTGWL